MSNLILAGRAGLHEMPLRTIWRRVGGMEYERTWWGPMATLEKSFRNITVGATEVQLQCAPGSAVGTITARYAGVLSGTELPIEVIDIQFADQTFPLCQNPSFINIDTASIIDLDEHAQNHEDIEITDTTLPDWQYFQLKVRGVDSYRVKMPTVVWTRTVSIDYPVALDLENTGAIFSTGNLAGSIGAPILFNIPTGNVGVEDPASGLFTAGWLKGAQATNSSDGKIQIVLTAEYGLWATQAYEFISG